jgi:hypothetical protein
MTFEEWYQSKDGIASLKAAWNAALAESGTRELYEACKESLVWLDSDSRGSEAAIKQCQDAIAKYESSVGAKP